MRMIAELASIGIQFPVSIGIGYLIGHALDNWLNTFPYLTAVFSVFGIAAAFVNMFRLTAELGRMEEKDRLEETENQPVEGGNGTDD